MIIDKAVVEIKAGNGGNGAIAFRREACVEFGGPAGGDGGRGGSVILVASHNINTLIDFKYTRKIIAPDGENGKGKKCYGHKGEDVYVKVPVGTVVLMNDTNEMLADLNEDGEQVVIAKGGRGGRGNCHFVSSRFQAPEIAENGEFGEKLKVRFELKMLADVGLVGFPSVGKSTLLATVSDAKPEIADYHFTTLSPILGVVRIDNNKSFVMADLPGLIEGASDGKGLGFEFLRHIERCRVLVHVIDMASTEGRDPYEDYLAIKEELRKYNPELLNRPQVIVANKMDEEQASLFLEEFKNKLEDNYPIYELSALTHDNLDKFIKEIYTLLEKTPRFPLFNSQDDYKVYLNDDEEFCKVRREDGCFIVYGKKVEETYMRTNISTDQGMLKLIRILRFNGVEDRLKEAGIKDGDIVKLCDFEFEYFE